MGWSCRCQAWASPRRIGDVQARGREGVGVPRRGPHMRHWRRICPAQVTDPAGLVLKGIGAADRYGTWCRDAMAGVTSKDETSWQLLGCGGQRGSGGLVSEAGLKLKRQPEAIGTHLTNCCARLQGSRWALDVAGRGKRALVPLGVKVAWVTCRILWIRQDGRRWGRRIE